ncbi:pre-toxin TG domain-containing protein [Streptomyces sp. NRRL F-5755]|uniref:pre-toxin TG domain-containing protein n=1 Tax=Streptomyces sp. NRRL F-5755 TaxID=1519475 RepID=UPI0006AFB2AE|nr:pre-toxin TG domain-containing protein [Streptomyces sp. NRRL F-5755]
MTLAIFITGGMSQALAADQKETPSALKKCLAEPFGKKLECIKKNARSEAFALLGIVLYLGASYDWKEQVDAQFPGLREKISGAKGAAPLIEAKMKEYLAAKEKKDPEAAEIYKNLTATIDSQKRVLGNIRDITQHSVQVVKATGDLALELAPVFNEAANIISDPEIHAALDEAIAGFGEMNQAINGLNDDVGGMNQAVDGMLQGINQMQRGLNEMIDGLDGMNQAMDQVNRGINGMIEGIDQANRGLRQMNQGIAEANRGMDQANRGVTGMNKAIDKVNDAIKTPIAKDGSSPFKDLDLSGIGDYVRGHSKVEESKAKEALVSLLLNLAPGIGDVKGVVEAIAGKDIITGEKLSTADRILGAAIVARWIKGGKQAIKAEDLLKAIENEKAFSRVGNVRWNAGGGGTTALGDGYKTPITPDLHKLINPDYNPKTDVNCRACALAVDKTLEGAPATALKIDRGGIRDLEKFYPGKRFRGQSFSNIVKEIKDAGDGARGIIMGATGKDGHAFNVVNRGGDVVLLDGQSGHADPTGYAKFAFMRTA